MKTREIQLRRMKTITNVASIDDLLDKVKRQGYQLEFRREADCLYCIELNCRVTPDSFIVDEYYHFEYPSDPDRDRILYAISSAQDLKGFLVDTCFGYEDNISPEMFQKLNMEYTLKE